MRGKSWRSELRRIYVSPEGYFRRYEGQGPVFGEYVAPGAWLEVLVTATDLLKSLDALTVIDAEPLREALRTLAAEALAPAESEPCLDEIELDPEAKAVLYRNLWDLYG